MKNIKKGVLIILILFNVFFPAIPFAVSAEDKVTNSPVNLTTGLPFFPKKCTDITEEKRKETLCYKNTSGDYTGDYNSQGLIKEVFEGVFKFILGSAGTLCVIMLIVSGLQIAFAAGNADILGAARGRMKDSIIGLILTVSSGFILSIINPQLLDFNFEEPTYYSIEGFKSLAGKERSACVLTFQDEDERLEEGKEKVGCDYGLYCYVKESDIEEGDVVGECKKYLKPGDNCIYYTERCQEGYECRQTAGNTVFTCIPSSSINNLKEGDFCIEGNNNCEDGFFCKGSECKNCDFYYNERETSNGVCPSSVSSYTPYCSSLEVEEECPLTLAGETCSLDGECEVIKCIEGVSKCAECLTDSSCDSDEFCNTGICQEKECENNKNCEDDEFCTKRTSDQYCRLLYSWCQGSCQISSKCN